MSITAIARDWGVNPAIVRITSTDSLATVGAAGYLTAQAANIASINSGEFEWATSDFVLVLASDGWGFFSVAPTFTALNVWSAPTGVAVVGAPVVVGNFAVYQSTTGNIKDLGYLPSDATKTSVVMAGSAVIVGRIAHFVDVNGTVDDTAGAVTNAGNIAAGLSGTAGTLSSFPATAANGSLILAAVNAGGAFNTTISNGTMGQSTVYTLGDIGASTGGIPVSTGAVRMKVVADAAIGGGSATQNVVDAFCTAASVVLVFWQTKGVAAAVMRNVVPGAGSFDIVSDIDAGAGTINYVIMK